MSEAASFVETYKGTPIYLSHREHVEHVGGTMYRVLRDDYFAVVYSPAPSYSLPGRQEHYLATSTRVEGVRRQIDGDRPRIIKGRPVKPVWVCDNHPPGSEIEVTTGEACSVCGLVEERKQ